MEKSIKIDSAMLAKASELYSFIFSIDEEYKNPAQGGERRDLIDGIFAILNGIKPLSYAKYFYDIVHEAFTGYYSTIVLSAQAEIPVHRLFRKVLNLRNENRRCNMDVPSRGVGRTV